MSSISWAELSSLSLDPSKCDILSVLTMQEPIIKVTYMYVMCICANQLLSLNFQGCVLRCPVAGINYRICMNLFLI